MFLAPSTKTNVKSINHFIVFHEKTEHVNHALPIAYLVDKFSTIDEQYKSFGIKYELDFSAIKDCRALSAFSNRLFACCVVIGNV